MNRLLALVIVSLVAFSCGSSASQEEADAGNAEVVKVAGLYGADLSEGDISDLYSLQTALDNDSEFTGKVQVKIEDVCQMKGCWMTAKLPDGRSMRITFKDYGFFVPKNSTGFTAIIEGKAVKKITDEATLKHYAEESGKSAEEIEKIDGPGEELSFIAEGVEIIESL